MVLDISNAIKLGTELVDSELAYKVKVKLDIFGFELYAYVTGITWNDSQEEVYLTCSPKSLPTKFPTIMPGTILPPPPPLLPDQLFLPHQLTLDFSNRNGYDNNQEVDSYEEIT